MVGATGLEPVTPVVSRQAYICQMMQINDKACNFFTHWGISTNFLTTFDKKDEQGVDRLVNIYQL